MLQYKYKWMSEIKINGFYWRISRVSMSVSYGEYWCHCPLLIPIRHVDFCTHLYHHFFSLVVLHHIFSFIRRHSHISSIFCVCARAKKRSNYTHSACSGLSTFHLYPFNNHEQRLQCTHTERHMTQSIAIYCLLNFHSTRCSVSLFFFFFLKQKMV